ncbi:unnamed protein product [Prorocentrum cordatum]|uniref:Uncharacterized protein n=1 Tax=Prorocentrum cordatum TaxID=2364126 RepID=A0ABN9WAF2_9DINO|nr:unnamed protein product [Polarella glacialis]
MKQLAPATETGVPAPRSATSPAGSVPSLLAELSAFASKLTATEASALKSPIQALVTTIQKVQQQQAAAQQDQQQGMAIDNVGAPGAPAPATPAAPPAGAAAAGAAPDPAPPPAETGRRGEGPGDGKGDGTGDAACWGRDRSPPSGASQR